MSAAQSSPTCRIDAGSGLPIAERAASKIAGCGLIVPTRWLTTTAARNGAQPAASTNRSTVAAWGQLERIASVRDAASAASVVETAGSGAKCLTNASLYAATPHAISSGV